MDTLAERCRNVASAESQGVSTEKSVDLEKVDEVGKIEEGKEIPAVMANVVIKEQAYITLRSNKWHNPSAPDYDMKLPPATYEEAMQRPDKDKWLEAMQVELQMMKDMNVYKVMKLPKGRKAIGCHWVLEFKEDNKGGSVYKARLVTQGFSQVPGVDYGATFAPVIKPVSVRLLVAFAAQHDWELDTFDVKHTFLWGILKEEIYMCQPKGFEDGDWCTIVWLMLRTIYGLKQSALEWYEQVCVAMFSLGFKRSECDHALFYYDELNLAVSTVRIRCFVGWHVDNGMAASNCRPFLQRVKSSIAERFRLKDLGPITKYLGMQFEHDRTCRIIWVHQSEYISFLLQEYGLLDCSPVHLPADPKAIFGLAETSYPEVTNLRSVYLKIIGELIYLVVNTHPDISYIVNALAQHNVQPETRHYTAAKRVLRYLAGMLDLCLRYQSDTDNKQLFAYADASWAKNQDADPSQGMLGTMLEASYHMCRRSNLPSPFPPPRQSISHRHT